MHNRLLIYAAALVIFGAGILLILEAGTRLHAGRSIPESAGRQSSQVSNPAPERQPNLSAPRDAAAGLRENLRHPVSVLLLQVITILLAAKAVGAFLRKAGQPSVVGEMLAGILLGPSLLGFLFPEAMSFLFPAPSLSALQLLSQMGVIIFMFVVGMEVDLSRIRGNAHSVVLISHMSILVPFFLGAFFSLLIYPSSAPPDISFTAFALFMSVAMSITAFPVLARILEERGLSRTYLGNAALACAAVDDVTAWCLLAVVIAIVKASGFGGAMLTISLTLIFIGVMLFVCKPQVERVIGGYIDGETRRRGLVPIVLVFVFASALCTEVIGIHALFGAFLAGAIMPSRDGLREFLKERLGVFTSGFLLPLFFASTGLRTQIGLLDDWASWLMCGGVVAVAIAGKLGGSMLATHWTGMSWQDSFSLGALMNTRGLIELIVLNIGYDLGILSPRIFSMMVIMALTTTFMTGPLLSIRLWERREPALGEHADVAA